MHVIYLIYHFLEAALFWDVSASFWFFLLIINRESQLYSSRQMRRDYKINFTNEVKANLWIHLDLAKVRRLKGLTSPYIVFYLDFLNLNNIMTLPKPLSSLRLGLIWRDLCLPLFLPSRLRRMRVSLRNQNKCKPSMSPSSSQTRNKNKKIYKRIYIYNKRILRKVYSVPWDCSWIENHKLNSRAFAHKSCMVRCSPHAPWF